MSRPAPIIVFAYKRPDHLRRTIAALRSNLLASTSLLVIACDGPRSDADRPSCAQVQAIADRTEGFASVEVRRAECNLGLSASVIGGVGSMLERHGRVIVLEDDMVVSPHFLHYMNDALECYAGDSQVASVHGYCYPVAEALPDAFFLRGADCWGWATWSRAWKNFEPDGRRLRDQLLESGLRREFDFDGSYPFFRMLEDQIAGVNDSWAIRWYASCFLANMLTLYPGRSLVINIGTDGSGTHCGVSQRFGSSVAQTPIRLARIPVQSSPRAREAFVSFYRSQQPWWRRLVSAIR